ncbi:hypothetical protein [uncultured Mailhella sp.]|uniref:hypothetical protein n=1 Tax=uncultured Mailhella sp. TaxID=1981031 RepID=UPI0025D78B09|nr:hypothetical protein [uncultured Mailhella sp.]
MNNVYEMAQYISSKLNFVSKDDDYLYKIVCDMYNHIWKEQKDIRGILALCALHKRKFKTFNADLIDLCYDGIVNNGHIDAVVYYCMAVIRNCSEDDAMNKIFSLFNLNISDNAKSILYIFIACCYWKKYDYENYINNINIFFSNKKEDFSPYIAIPTSSVWRSLNRPIQKENKICDMFYPNVDNNFDYIISASCDDKYFNAYGKYFIKSLNKLKSNFFCYIAIIANEDIDISEYNNINNIKIDILYNNSCNIGPISSSIRYINAFKIMEKTGRPVVVCDFDSVFINDIIELIDNRYDAKLRILKNVLPWETITAGFSIFMPTINSLKFLEIMTSYFSNILVDNTKQWWVDQNALECAMRFTNIKYINIINNLNNYIFIPTGSMETKKVLLNSKVN